MKVVYIVAKYPMVEQEVVLEDIVNLLEAEPQSDKDVEKYTKR